MVLTLSHLKMLATRHRVHAEAIGVAAFAFIAFTVLGIAARHRLATAQLERTRASSVAAEVSDFRNGFRSSQPGGESLPSSAVDAFAIAAPRDTRVSLAQQVASSAESAGLTGVRVMFATPDSAAPPVRPELFSATVAVADYTIVIEGAGSFAAVLSLVNELPASVALERLIAVRDKSGSHYRLTLAVFEPGGPTQHG